MITFLFALALAQPNPDFIEEARANWEGLTDPEVISVECGEDNAFYSPSRHLVIMCSELYDRPDLAVFIFHHEMAHAMTLTHGFPRVSHQDRERIADELAFFMSTVDQVMAGARFFLDIATEAQSEFDPHPAALDRAASLICLAEGREGRDRMCRAYYDSLLAHWQRLILLLVP